MAGLRDKIVDEDEIRRRSEEFQAKHASPPQEAMPEEEGAEEGDISNYVLPFTGIGRKLLTGIIEGGIGMAVKSTAKEGAKKGAGVAERAALDYAKDKVLGQPKPAPVAGPNYKGENIAFRPPETGKQVGWERFSFGKKP